MLRALTLETRVQPVSAIASEAESRATKASARPNQGATKRRGASEPRQLASMCTCAILGDPRAVHAGTFHTDLAARVSSARHSTPRPLSKLRRCRQVRLVCGMGSQHRHTHAHAHAPKRIHRVPSRDTAVGVSTSPWPKPWTHNNLTQLRNADSLTLCASRACRNTSPHSIPCLFGMLVSRKWLLYTWLQVASGGDHDLPCPTAQSRDGSAALWYV